MIRTAPGTATMITAVPVQGLDGERALVALEFNPLGRLRGFSVKPAAPPDRETPEEKAARELAQGVAGRLRTIGSLPEAIRRARVALDFLEQLEALEQLHGEQARQVLRAGDRAA